MDLFKDILNAIAYIGGISFFLLSVMFCISVIISDRRLKKNVLAPDDDYYGGDS